jgi:hypothetical protein
MHLLKLGIFHGSTEVTVAVCEWLQVQGPDLYHSGTFKFVPRWHKCIKGIRNCDYKCIELIDLHLSLCVLLV